MRRLRLGIVCFAVIGLVSAINAQAGEVFPPPQGKGPVVMVASGMSGPDHYRPVAKEIAALGYDVVLFDGNAVEGTHGDGVVAAIQEAKPAPHGLRCRSGCG